MPLKGRNRGAPLSCIRLHCIRLHLHRILHIIVPVFNVISGFLLSKLESVCRRSSAQLSGRCCVDKYLQKKFWLGCPLLLGFNWCPLCAVDFCPSRNMLSVLWFIILLRLIVLVIKNIQLVKKGCELWARSVTNDWRLMAHAELFTVYCYLVPLLNDMSTCFIILLFGCWHSQRFQLSHIWSCCHLILLVLIFILQYNEDETPEITVDRFINKHD